MQVLNNPLAIVKTNTDEWYFPSRLIYRIASAASVLKPLEKLNCVYKHPGKECWLIVCTHEALAIHPWNEPYRKAIRQQAPITIGTVNFPNPRAMHVYTRAFRRVVPLLNLLDKHLPRTVALGTHHDICYKLITTSNPGECPTPEDIFADENKIHYSENLRLIDQMEEEARQSGQDYSKQINVLFYKEFQDTTCPRQRFVQDLERKRLESFYIEGEDEYSRILQMQETLAVAKHLAGGKLDSRNFFEQLIINHGKSSMNIEDFLKTSE